MPPSRSPFTWDDGNPSGGESLPRGTIPGKVVSAGSGTLPQRVWKGDLLEVDAPATEVDIDENGNWVAVDGEFAYTLNRRIYRFTDGEWSSSVVNIYQNPVTSNFALGSVFADTANFSIETDVGAGDGRLVRLPESFRTD